ncbi:Rap1a/Tai family immunity protein [Pseudomonas luteola]
MKIKPTLIALALTLCAGSAFAKNQQLTSQSMVSMCSNTNIESVSYTACMANINGYLAGLVHAKVLDEVENNIVSEKETDLLKLHDICLQPYVNNYQLSQVFIKYGTSHPETADNDFFTVFYESMQEAFPCSNH